VGAQHGAKAVLSSHFPRTHFKQQAHATERKSAIVFAPHQDDETFGCGGLIALKRERGIPVKVVILTDGAACFGDAATDADRERITRLRNEEVVAATVALGLPPENLEFLSYPDGGLDSLSDVERTQAVDSIATLLEAFQPEEVYVTHRHDRHSDHERPIDWSLMPSDAPSSPLTFYNTQYGWSGSLVSADACDGVIWREP
jgi:LmbE family N-acetylglucosaminyl deacetylase